MCEYDRSARGAPVTIRSKITLSFPQDGKLQSKASGPARGREQVAITNRVSLHGRERSHCPGRSRYASNRGNHRLKMKQRPAEADRFFSHFHLWGIPLLLRSVGTIMPKGAIEL